MATRTKATVGKSSNATKPEAAESAGTFGFSEADRARMQAEFEALQSERESITGGVSWMRLIGAGIGSLIAAGTTYYVGLTVTETIAIAAAALTGSAFITFLICFVGVVLSYLATCVVLPVTFAYLKDVNVDGVTQTLSAAGNKLSDLGTGISGRVSGWFTKRVEA